MFFLFSFEAGGFFLSFFFLDFCFFSDWRWRFSSSIFFVVLIF